ncbi:MAG TPA: TetR/AcrR family transcriptional regulator, partial [Polyangiaceae bacterium]
MQGGTCTQQKSTGVSNLRDARARRTRERIDAAFVDLLHRRTYDGIRVSDVTRQSGVGRATFYAHHASKDALLRSQMERLVVPRLRPAPPEQALLDATPFFAHVLEAPWIYRSLMTGAGRRVVTEAVEARVAAILEGAPRPAHDIPAPLVARVVAYALIGLVS